MKKIISFLVKVSIAYFLLFMLYNCASRKSATDKYIADSTFEIKDVERTSLSKDSISEKTAKADTEVSKSEERASWKYTAPATLPNEIKPFWLKINGDSIDLSKLPAGSSLETNSETTKSKEQSKTETKENTSTKIDKTTDVGTEYKYKIKTIYKTKIVEKKSTQWQWNILAFVLGFISYFLLKFLVIPKIPFLKK